MFEKRGHPMASREVFSQRCRRAPELKRTASQRLDQRAARLWRTAHSKGREQPPQLAGDSRSRRYPQLWSLGSHSGQTHLRTKHVTPASRPTVFRGSGPSSTDRWRVRTCVTTRASQTLARNALTRSRELIKILTDQNLPRRREKLHVCSRTDVNSIRLVFVVARSLF